MKGDDRYKQIGERIANTEKFSMRDETSHMNTDGPSKVHEDQNHGKAVTTGLHGDTSEQEVEQQLRETIMEIGMSTENAKIECIAKPVTHVFTYFKDNDERNKCVRSANMCRKEQRGRKIKISRSMVAEEKINYITRDWVYQLLLSHETAFLSIRFIELDLKIRVG